MKKRFHTTRHKKTLLIVAAIVGCALVFLVLEKTGITSFTPLSKADTPNRGENPDAQTTSDAPTAQEDFTGGDDNRNPGNTLKEDEGSAVILDNEGSLDGSVDTTNPIVSSTGEISLFTPRPNELAKSGLTVAGNSSLQTVSYRVIDSISGVIAAGKLSVVNGKFSGTLNFETSAKEGRLDIFGAKNDGTEFSNIEIAVRFK